VKPLKISNEKIKYFGGFNQNEVKPTGESPLLKLGIENVPPIITSGLLLDVRKYANDGKKYLAGEFITKKDLEVTLRKSGLDKRGILKGDVIMIYSGWSDFYKRFTDLIKERFNIDSMRVKKLLNQAENDEIIIKYLLILSFCISNQGYQKLKNFLYDF